MQKLKEKESALRLAEQNILSRDKVINELRLRLPATAEREKLIADLSRREMEPKSHYTMKIAHQTIINMQARLNQKDEILKKYQHLLEKAREVFYHIMLCFFISCCSVKCHQLFWLKW
jgi:centrosomal protein CEP290